MNDNGERLVEFCLSNRCIIGGTVFPHRDIHKLSWILMGILSIRLTTSSSTRNSRDLFWMSKFTAGQMPVVTITC